MFPIIPKAAANFATIEDEIPVEFVVLHYTACSLEETLRLFSSPETKTCAHFVISEEGTIYDLGDFYEGPIRRGAHAGQSRFSVDSATYESFNAFSIGIELVHYNGNFLPYPVDQISALTQLLAHLLSRFPALRNPQRIVGHEHIAGFRGKVDPGLCFNWAGLYQKLYPNAPVPSRPPLLSADSLRQFQSQHGSIEPQKMTDRDWIHLSQALESFAANLA